LIVDKEYLYGDHKRVEGVQLPTRYVELTSGKKLVEAFSVSYRFLPQVDEKTFAKP
jgi:hypothetical protein